MPKSLLFVAAALVVLAGLGLFALPGIYVGHGMAPTPMSLNVLLAHVALPPLCLLSGLGLLFRRRWAWWMGLATFGVLAALAAIAVWLVGMGEDDAWILASLYSICAAPSALLLRPGRVYRDVLR